MSDIESHQPNPVVNIAHESDVKGDDFEMNEKSQVAVQARLATESEHALTTLQAIKAYPWAMFWSAIFTSSLIMVGYDGAIIYSFYGLPAFLQQYGTDYGGDIGYEISAPWQNALGLGAPVGQLVGAFLTSYPLERFGRKKVFGACLTLTTMFIFLEFFAVNISMLAAGEFLAGLLYGSYLVVAPTYVSEVCPMALRGVMNAAINLGYVIGHFIASGVGDAFANNLTQWAYRK